MQVCETCYDFAEVDEREGLEVVEDGDCELCREEF
jgi:hypothetical protein